jgi:hypothetical protein
MPAMDQKVDIRGASAMSGLLPKADIAESDRRVEVLRDTLLLFDPVQAPPLGHAFESVNAAILKADS